MPVTLEDLVDANRRLADSNFATAAAINKLVPAFEQLRRDIYDLKTDRETDQSKLDLAIGRVSTDLAVLLENIRHAQTDVRELQRDVTGAHVLPPPDNRSAAERLIEKYERMPTSTKLWIFALVIVVGAAFGAHLIIGAFTGG
jgi:hypothetical protein